VGREQPARLTRSTSDIRLKSTSSPEATWRLICTGKLEEPLQLSYGKTAAALPVFAGFTCGALLACTFIFLPSEVSGQVATCFDTELTTQTEVDHFDPNCTLMVGDLVINDRSPSSTGAIRNLTPLRNLEQVNNLVIHNNNDLSSLNGLNIERVTNCLSIANNPRLGSANWGARRAF